MFTKINENKVYRSCEQLSVQIHPRYVHAKSQISFVRQLRSLEKVDLFLVLVETIPKYVLPATDFTFKPCFSFGDC